MKIVIDTNILINAWQDDFSYTRKIIDEVMAGNIQAVVSHKIWREYQLILDRLVNDPNHHELAQKFISAVEEVRPKIKVEVVKYDREDNKFFEAALAGGAEYIISNDMHLLEVGEHQGVKVLKPENFWAEYDKDSGNEWQEWMRNVMGR